MGMEQLGPIGHPVPVLAARVLLATVFLMAGLSKVRLGRTFVADVEKYRILPGPLAAAYALALPWLEVGSALLLLTGVLLPLGAAVALALLATFVIATASATARRMTLTCSCFGLLYREHVGVPTLARDLVLAGFAAQVLLGDGGLGLQQATSGAFHVGDVLLLALMGVVVVFSGWAAWRAAEGADAGPAVRSDESRSVAEFETAGSGEGRGPRRHYLGPLDPDGQVRYE